jgi:hypothetical protein
MSAFDETQNGQQNTEQIKRKVNKKLEENEDAICDDWEQLNQQKIEKSLQTKKIVSNTNIGDEEKQLINGLSSSSVTNAAFNAPLFVNQPVQSIKILKRPASNKNLTELTLQQQREREALQPIKTFEQREQEYAQARLRILGSAHPEQESLSANSNFNNPSSSSNNYQQQGSGGTNRNSFN